MKKLVLFAVVVTFVCSMAFSALAEIKLTVAEVHPEDYPTTLGLKMFADLVKERSKGEIVIDVKFGGVLGKDEKAVVEQVQIGALDMARTSTAPVTDTKAEMPGATQLRLIGAGSGCNIATAITRTIKTPRVDISMVSGPTHKSRRS